MSKGAQLTCEKRTSSPGEEGAFASLDGACLKAEASLSPSQKTESAALNSLSFSASNEITRVTTPETQRAIGREPLAKTITEIKLRSKLDAVRGNNPTRVLANSKFRGIRRVISAPLTIIDRFMLWLERQIKAFVEKFLARLMKPETPFLSLLFGKRAKAKDLAKEKERAKKKDLDKKAKAGPSVSR